MPPKRPLRIFCFGDSLTAGYSGFGSSYTPYSEVLETKLAAAFPDADVRVHENGMPGDIVSAEAFNRRLRAELDEAKTPYDWVLILGGTNDIAYKIAPETIVDNLKESYRIALDKGSKVLALTVPETHARARWVVDARRAVNEGIMAYDDPRFYAFDLASAIPYFALPPPKRTLYWDDGVHLTPSGYEWMGGHVADALIKIMIEEATAAAAAGTGAGGSQGTRRARRMLRYAKDELLFEEETGDPSLIHEGYVIVRLKDLN
ncbi:hypothetical protein BN1708_002981 [Verticillium longisporum]|uniref:SGNH hydrolase-type esterase domain-containing protein n=1 Tax=Verticillium longisporum TaxID=100787 RepID=A0A0G4L6T4_VERLO|nr:hypothetical protein HYQ44_019399 [Verticillium longisporum]CRK17698.1 hypothetical protein BN1708_002981 [Verticillium longisporum]